MQAQNIDPFLSQDPSQQKRFDDPPRYSGQISKTLLILAVVIIVIIILVFFAFAISSPKKQTNNTVSNTTTPVIQEPVYETQIGDVKFLLQSSDNLGSELTPPTNSFQQPLKTTENFYKVTIGAQNKGKITIKETMWEMGNIVD